jgi:hypothetical protein
MRSPVAESEIRQAVARMEAATAKGGLPCGTCRVLISDIYLLFETLRRYGGRRDWTPTWPNIDRLPGPVKRHIYEMHVDLQRAAQRLNEAEQAVTKLARLIEAFRHPPR